MQLLKQIDELDEILNDLKNSNEPMYQAMENTHKAILEIKHDLEKE